MKTLDVVVKKREELNAELDNAETNLNILRRRKYNELLEDEKEEARFLWSVVLNLKIQIDALTYVINYDSKLRDVTIKPQMRNT